MKKVYVLTWGGDPDALTVHATLKGAKARASRCAREIDTYYADHPALKWTAARNVWHADVEMDVFMIQRLAVRP